MKTYYTLAVAILLTLSSCNISRTGCYTGSINKQQFTVAMESRGILSPIDNVMLPIEPPMIQEAEPFEISNTFKAKEAMTEEPVFLAMATEENIETDNSDAPPLTITAIMADNLRSAATTMESRFTKRILNKSANRIEKMNFSSANTGKITFMDKMRAKVSQKLLVASAPPGDGGALAIVSLITGILAFAWYASFVLGVVAIVTGAIALAKGTSRRGMALAGLILGAIAIALWSGIIGGGVL